MLFRFFSLLLLGLLARPATAQKEFNVWCFGEAKADFNQRPVDSRQTVIRNQDVVSNTASIADADGQLLFYASTRNVYTRLGQVMPNGLLRPNSAPVNVSLGVAIVPVPYSTTRFYVFNMNRPVGAVPDNSGNDVFLYCAVVDMNANNGLGAVIEPNQLALPLPVNFNRLVVVRHQNCRDYWVVVRTSTSRTFLTLPVTADGIGASIPSLPEQGPYTYGASGFASPDGNRLVWAGREFTTVNGLPYGQDCFTLYDFDKSTGRISNPQRVWQFAALPVANNVSAFDVVYRGYQLAFSPNGRVLYSAEDSLDRGTILPRVDLFQYDLAQPLPLRSRSRRLLTTMPTPAAAQDSAVGFSNPRLAPDSTIWVLDQQDWRANQRDGSPPMYAAAAILRPDVVGPACLLRRRSHWFARGISLGRYPPMIANTLFVAPTLHYEAGCPGDTVRFWAGNTGGSQPVWDFDDPASGPANSARGPFARHHFARAGTYAVRLALPNGRVLTQPVTVAASTGAEQTRATVFTPNADGRNDAFEPVAGTGLAAAHLRVFSRWGQLVYEARTPAPRWDGDGAAAGVYFYQLDYVDCRGRPQALKGLITLSR